MEREVKIYIGNAAIFNPENLYTVSGYTVTDTGEIYSGGVRVKEYLINGYKYVLLPLNGKNKKCKVHRIVATTYQDICGEFNEVVNHLDENRFNNSARNLQWTTNSDNITWGTLRERQTLGMKKNSALRKLVREFYRAHDIQYKPGIKITELKTCFRLTDKINGYVFYTEGKNPTLDHNKGDYKKIYYEHL